MSNYWMETHSGLRFDLLEPRPEMVNIADIAWHLAHICRFTGACNRFYSVADHSVRVCNLLPKELRLAGLLHDAHEAYIGDISRPLKALIADSIRPIQARIQGIINSLYHIDIADPRIHIADNLMLAMEAKALMPSVGGWDIEGLVVPDSQLIPMRMDTAEQEFLKLFEKYRVGG